ncbi:hypothetical protein PBT90_13855 [Algoriphagus halophytocola]|uniref:Prolin-rich transmembrane protein n=1 Tax=Algoriphagus halophytocola TaxID=2991499 RepID=A0ABY6ML21_9BACT|nr:MULTISPECIES: DUF6600 domain-containing protein [unclassified Algoriphagus]UZD24473.1 hypothetical protein OM944_08210 [Algoriphagus sp. TR-M5]WBL41837.1 hypothetical protein PBT90_13855 [Algoriphagus sp. TR-M9]
MKTPTVPRWMKSLIIGILALAWLNPNEAKAESPLGVSFQVFYDELMPYGDWVKDARYGYVWLPAVYQDFHPYGTNGHWVMTSYGNTWVSEYDWGWATFHYGRWYYDEHFQSWAWIPGYEWGPAWVDWRTGGGYYGWAPMGPGFSVSVRVNIPAFHWIFVPQRRFVYRNVYSYCVPRARRVNIYNSTTIINNTVVYNNNHYYAGPSRRDVERVTRRSYPELRVQNSRSPGRVAVSRNTVNVYRPDLQSARETKVAARPSRTLAPGQARTKPSVSPSRVGTRSESVSERSASTPARSSRSVESPSSPSRKSSSTSRPSSTSPSRSGFETKPYSGSQTRSATPSRQNQAPASRNSETRPSRPSAQSSPSNRTTETRSTPARTQSSSPRTSTRSQSAPKQKAAPARSQSTPNRIKSSPSRTSTKSTPARSSSSSKSSRSSSSSSSSTGSSRSRGNTI